MFEKLSHKIIAGLVVVTVAGIGVSHLIATKPSDVDEAAKNNNVNMLHRYYSGKIDLTFDEPRVRGTAAKHLIRLAESNNEIKAMLLKNGISYKSSERLDSNELYKAYDIFLEVCGRDACVFYLQNLPDVDIYSTPTSEQYRTTDNLLQKARYVYKGENEKEINEILSSYKSREEEYNELQKREDKQCNSISKEIEKLRKDEEEYRGYSKGMNLVAYGLMYNTGIIDPRAFAEAQGVDSYLGIVRKMIAEKKAAWSNIKKETKFKQGEIAKEAIRKAYQIKKDVFAKLNIPFESKANSITRNYQNSSVQESTNQKVYAGENGTFTEIPTAEVLSMYQGKWQSPDGMVSFEIQGDAIREKGKAEFVKVHLLGKGTIVSGEAHPQFVNPPSGYSYVVNNIFRLYWNMGVLEAEYYDGRGAHTTIRRKLINVK